MDPNLIQDFQQKIESLVGKTCWSVQISGVGSLANLQLGAQVKRDQPMLHQDFEIEMEERAFQGEAVLFLEECPWRLDGPEAVLASWMDSSEAGGRIRTGLTQLKGRRIERAELTTPGLDLTLWFEGGFTLRIFPDQVDPDEGDNYSLTFGESTYIIAANSILYED